MGPALNADSTGRVQRGDLGSPRPLLWKMLAMARLRAPPPAHFAPPGQGSCTRGTAGRRGLRRACAAIDSPGCVGSGSPALLFPFIPGSPNIPSSWGGNGGLGVGGGCGSLVPTWRGCGMSWGAQNFPTASHHFPVPSASPSRPHPHFAIPI